jgi:hypothetical protein
MMPGWFDVAIAAGADPPNLYRSRALSSHFFSLLWR